MVTLAEVEGTEDVPEVEVVVATVKIAEVLRLLHTDIEKCSRQCT